MITLRSANERGSTRASWLDSRHSFSFGQYRDPRWPGFHNLVVINEDFISGGGKFGMHPHENMEILTYVLEGAVAHRDSTGSSGIIRPGEVQRMSAGTGIFHSEANESWTEPLHLYQIWLLPSEEDIEPGYEQKTFADATGLRLVAAPGARDGSLLLRSDATVYSGKLGAGENAEYPLAAQRAAWLQVARGAVTVNGRKASAGDGVALEDEQSVQLHVVRPRLIG